MYGFTSIVVLWYLTVTFFMFRIDKAIECQKHVVAAVKKGGSQFHVTLTEAEKKLKELLQQAKS